jgi:hypothetical protein
VRFCECFGVVGGGTLEISLQGGNAWFLSFLIHRYAAQLLLGRASCSCYLGYALILLRLAF